MKKQITALAVCMLFITQPMSIFSSNNELYTTPLISITLPPNNRNNPQPSFLAQQIQNHIRHINPNLGTQITGNTIRIVNTGRNQSNQWSLLFIIRRILSYLLSFYVHSQR